MIPAGRAFFKMSGSGNDFVMVDARTESRGALGESAMIRRLCARGTGVGADGIVFLEPSNVADIRLTYINADGSPADFCGNATLCTTRLAAELGAVDVNGFMIETEAGLVAARIQDGLPEIDLPPVTDVRLSPQDIPLEAGELRIGYALVGVPHLVIECEDVSTIDVVGRGRPLRSHPTMPRGANVNFVSRGRDGRWRYRTYERGVEAETLACGSGSVATAIFLTIWNPPPDAAIDSSGVAKAPAVGPTSGSGEDQHDEVRAESTSVELETRSGKPLKIRLRRDARGWNPSLAGEGRIVFKGSLAET